METVFEGEAYPSKDERRKFGYRPNRIYILNEPGNVDDNQRFTGFSVDEILDEMDKAYLGFEYINEDVWLEKKQEDGEKVSDLREVPVYQREAVPASITPGEKRLNAMREIEDMNSSVADSSFSLVFYNEGRVRNIDRIGEEISNTSLNAFPDIRGVELVAYWPQTNQANLIQYSSEIQIPKEPMGDERGALIDRDTDFRTVKYPRDEKSIRQLMNQHEDWNITKNTLGSHEIPPEVYTEETGQE
ncbi:MAG: hypothetical protein BRC30_00450 [Nanohaloarchaea archaeon SW_7_46_7]|nr:MAG: hypothetical protein BRC30_00450 [Nanohaloarchaea archaeon SW_7_46_7]